MSNMRTKAKKDINKTKTLIICITLIIFVLVSALSLLLFMRKSEGSNILAYFSAALIIPVGLLFILLKRFFNAIGLIENSSNQMSQGRLNISDILVDKTKGLETLAIAFNDMKSNLLSFIESTKSNVIVLSDAIDKVSKSIDMSYQGNEQIASNMNTVAEKAHEQLKIVNDTIERIKEVNDRTSNITDTLAKIEDFVGITVKSTVDGSEHLDKYNEQMKIISDNLQATTRFIAMLNNNLQEIDQVGGLIINITEQLKLLSLNSAVEAARAGEAGRGFAIVSQEMNKLSSATRDSIGKINNLLSDILESNSKVSSSIDSCVKSYEISNQIFNLVKDSFYTINKNASILSEDMKKVYDEALQISESTHDISVQGNILYDASNEISSITQDVAAVTQEELAENEEINNQALALKGMLTDIQKLLLRYKTSVLPVKEDSAKNLRIVMMSPLDVPFWKGVRQGVLFAQNELKNKNVTVEYIGLNPMSNHEFIKIFDQKIEEGCDGIIIPGFVGGIEPSVMHAINNNTVVISFNCDLPDNIKRLAYFGPDVYQQGTLAGNLMIKACDGEGKVAIFRGKLSDSINKIRVDTVLASLNAKKKIKIVTELEAVDDDELVYNKTKEVLNAHPDLKGIIITSGGAMAMARAIEELGFVGKTKIVCFDHDQDIIELIKKGIVYGAMGQDPFGQGHDPVISLYNYLAANVVPDEITHTRLEVVDRRSVSE